MMTKYYTILLAGCIMLAGCQTTAKVQNSDETTQQEQDALKAVAGALSGKQLSDEELRNLNQQIKNDEEAQSAIRSITESVGGKVPIVKYCPVDGERFAAHIQTCPDHKTELEIVGE